MQKYDKKGDISFAIGTTLVYELLNRKSDMASKIYISPKMNKDGNYDKLAALAKSKDVPIIANNEKIFKSLSDKDNVMAIGEFRKYEGSINKTANHVVLVNPMNMGNVGTIIRSCAAFGIDGLYIIKPASDIFDPKCIRSSMGSIFSINFKYFDSFEQYLNEAGDRQLYPFMLQAKKKLNEINKPNSPFTLIFGNEAKGLDKSFLDVGIPTIIPQSSVVDSLNLDNAVSIGLYHFCVK